MYETENIEAITKFLFIENEIGDLKKSDLLIVLCNNNIKGIAKLFDELYKRSIIEEKNVIMFIIYW